jgi:monoamine oxidase
VDPQALSRDCWHGRRFGGIVRNDDRDRVKDKGVSIAWQNVPFQLGGWVDWSDTNPGDHEAYTRLLRPDGRFHVVGDQVSTLPGWQEGAMMSAEHVVSQIGLLLKAPAIPEIVHLPNTRRLVQGTN